MAARNCFFGDICGDDPVFFGEFFHCRGGCNPFREFVEFFVFHEHFPVLSVMRKFAEKRCFVISEMGKSVCGQFVSAHRAYQSCDLARATGHQRAFERGISAPVQNARDDPHNVFRRRAYLRTDHIFAVIKADQIAFEFFGMI